MIALLGACLLILGPAILLGWKARDSIRTQLGLAYAKNTALLTQQKILTPLIHDLSLTQQLANSAVTRDWILDENNKNLRDSFFREAESYRKSLFSHTYFITLEGSQNHYFNQPGTPITNTPRFRLSRDDARDSWYFNTLNSDQMYNVNVDYDTKVKATKVWFNIIVHDGERKIGLLSSGLDFDQFLKEFIASRETGLTTMIVNAGGAIQAHPDPNLVSYRSGAGGEVHRRVFDLLDTEQERHNLRAAMKDMATSPTTTSLTNNVQILWGTFDGKRHMLAVAYIPQLRWYVISAVDLQTTQMLDGHWDSDLLIALIAILVLILLSFAYTVECLVLRPLRGLQLSAEAIATGQYDIPLPKPRADEIGHLSMAFSSMADQIRRYTRNLEDTVQQRTHALERANQEMTIAQKRVNDSIDYASLIQRATLPDRRMQDALGARHCVLWKPRDVVGGDFYIYHEYDGGTLIGVVDCAGHGVPGALMTMLALAVINQAIDDTQSPAVILHKTDEVMRSMFSQNQLTRELATNMDAGLVHLDADQRRLIFSGAKISLFASDGNDVIEYKGGRRAIGDRRQGAFEDTEIPLQPGWTFCLCTDGFFDQAGGEQGFGFGNQRFIALLRDHANRPLDEQAKLFSTALAAYQGDYPQRDDITVFFFRFDEAPYGRS